MYKKALYIITLCIICISSIAYANNSQSRELSIYLGDSLNLKTWIEEEEIDFPLTASDTIQVSDTHIISIDDDFNIEGLSVGESLIVIANSNNNFISVKVIIKSPIKEIQLFDQDLTLFAGEIYPLNYTVVAQDDYYKHINKELYWTNSKNNIVGVKGNNKLYTYGVGSTILTGTTFDGSHTINLNVKVIGNPNNLIIKPQIVDSSVNVGEIRQLNAFFDTKNVTRHVKWESEFPEILKIDENGLVTPLRSGTCKVTAQSSIDRKKDTYTFFVKSMVDKISLDANSIFLKSIGDQAQLHATLTYVNPDVTPLRDGFYYESSNDNIVTVTQDGLITAQGSGIALVSAIAYDSGKKSSCSVEVAGEEAPTTIDFTAVRDINLFVDSDPMIIGQKVPLNYDIYPTDATDQTVKFDVINNDLNQIQLIDNQYYFIPNERGTFRVKISANGSVNEVSDEVEFTVKSPLASLDLDIGIERDSTSEKRLYVGEKTEIITNIYTQGYYSAFDVYPNTLDYSVDDPDVLKLEYLNGKYYITALGKGSTYIRVKNIEERYEESLEIKVINPISQISTNREVKLPINIYYAPEFNYMPTSASASAKISELEANMTLKVEDFYFAESYIDQEIQYENEILKYFNSTVTTPTTKSNIAQHETRLKYLKNLKNRAVNGYCLVSDNLLKNRNFMSYRYYNIRDNEIIGYYPGKAKVSISVKGSSTNATTMIDWQYNTAEFAIKSTNKWLNSDDIIASEGLSTEFATLNAEERIKYIIYYLNHKKNLNNTISTELITALMALENNKLPTPIFNNLNALTTKDELAYISMYLDNVYNDNQMYKTNHIVYYDVINDTVKQAIAAGYVQPASNNYLGASEIITFVDFKSAVNRIYPDNQLPETLTKPMTHEEVILLLNKL